MAGSASGLCCPLVSNMVLMHCCCLAVLKSHLWSPAPGRSHLLCCYVTLLDSYLWLSFAYKLLFSFHWGTVCSVVRMPISWCFCVFLLSTTPLHTLGLAAPLSIQLCLLLFVPWHLPCIAFFLPISLLGPPSNLSLIRRQFWNRRHSKITKGLNLKKKSIKRQVNMIILKTYKIVSLRILSKILVSKIQWYIEKMICHKQARFI